MQSAALGASFVIFSVTAVVLCLNLLVLWGYSGTVRTRAKATPNPEDATTVAKGADVAIQDPPEIARVLRAHRNAEANILPFLVLAWLSVAWGAAPLTMGIVCGIFVVARLGHTVTYLAGKQPYRTIFFTIGGLDTLALIALLVQAMVRAAP
jgi:uncharacterized MAPEG superfamily protein